jgi:DHA1 family multidrug resistance protein-like MFS transporter
VGQLINTVSNGRLLPYPEERSDFVLPSQYRGDDKASTPTATIPPEEATEVDSSFCPTPGIGITIQAQLVDWYGQDDPENPRNWSVEARCSRTF